MITGRAAALALAGLLYPTLVHATEQWLTEGWSLSAFAGPWSNNASSEIFFEREWRSDSWAIGAGAAKELMRWDDRFALEAELQAARHIAGESHWVFSGLVVARFLDFPWNEHVETTAALGYGPSFATTDPGSDTDSGEGRLIAGVMVELTFAPPDSNWAGLIRYQHRSSSFGVFSDGQQDEGTGPMVGLRYQF